MPLVSRNSLALLVLLNLVACATVEVHGEVQGDKAFPSFPEHHPVSLYWDRDALPTASLVEVGRILGETTKGSWEDLSEAMKVKARQMGADVLLLTSSTEERVGRESTVSGVSFFASASVRTLHHKTREAIAFRRVGIDGK